MTVLCRLGDLKKIYEYDGKETCAADGMCQEKCPVKINTGELIKDLRARDIEAAASEGGIAMVSPSWRRLCIHLPKEKCSQCIFLSGFAVSS